MKKILLSAAAIFAAMSLNAQEFCSFNPDNALNLDAENGTALTAGTVIGETTSIVAKIGADDTYKPQSATFTANGEIISGGLQGATNPKDADGGTPASTLLQPASGAFLQFEAKADGFLYVMHKASSNKAYTVFEEGTAISYTFAAIGDASSLLGGVYSFTLPYEVENEQFVVKNPVEWAEQEFLKSTNPDAYAANWKEETADDGTTKQTWDPAIKINGLGVIKFPVYKDCKYIVNANGSKITAAGFAFSTEDNVLIQSDDVVIYKGEGAAEPVKKVYSVIGTLNGNWDTDDDMVKGEDGIYTFVFENVAAGEYKFKVRQDHDWAINWGHGDDADGNTVFTVENDGSTVTISFNPATEELKYEVIEPQHGAEPLKIEGAEGAMEYGGTWAGNWWNLNEDMNADISGYDYLWIDYDGFEGAIQFGIFYSEWQKTESWGEVWYTDQVDLTDAAGVVGIKIEKTKIIETGIGGVESEYKGDIYAKHARQVFTQDKGKASKINIKGIYLGSEADFEAAKAGGSAINSVKKAANADGAIYNIAGQKVNASYKGLVIKNGKKYIQK
jgi:hypothetical protein